MFNGNIARTTITLSALTFAAASVHAQDRSPWTLRAWGGLGLLAETGIDGRSGAPNPSAHADFDAGFATGAGLAYSMNPNWSVEADFMYRTNDQQTPDLLGGTRGDFSSGQLALRLSRHWPTTQWAGWSPTLTAGLAYGQEIDIDAETADSESSYSGSGDLGLELGARVSRTVAPGWMLDVELRHVRFGDVDMQGEAGATGSLTADYAHTAVLLGLGWNWGS